MNNQFQSRFSTTDYLNTSYKRPGDSVLRDFVIRKVHEFFKATPFDTVKPGECLKVLDYGSGPVIAHVISAAGIDATEIVLADFTDGCRKAVQQWLDKAPSAWDWTPYIKYVVQALEGKQDEREVLRREENLRQSIKAVVPCDISKASPIAEGFDGPCYDIVISILCLDCACETKDEFKAAIQKLTSLIKPGGYLLLCCGLQTKEHYGHFHIRETKFLYIGMSVEFILESLKEGGFVDVNYHLLPEEDLSRMRKYYECNEDGLVFIAAKYRYEEN